MCFHQPYLPSTQPHASSPLQPSVSTLHLSKTLGSDSVQTNQEYDFENCVQNRHAMPYVSRYPVNLILHINRLFPYQKY